MTRYWLTLIGVCLPALAAAQPANQVSQTLVTLNTGVTSICVGGNTPSAPSTCLGGIQAGPGVINSGLTLPSGVPGVTTNKLYSSAGTLFWNGSAVAVGGAVGPGTVGTIPIFSGVNSIGNSLLTQAGTVLTLAGTVVSNVLGISSFTTGAAGQEGILIQNTAAGTGNSATLGVSSNTVNAALTTYSSTWTTSGTAIQSSTLLSTSGSGGLGLQAQNAGGAIVFYTGGATERGTITNAGLWNWETFGAHQFSAGGTGVQALRVSNTTAGAANQASVQATAGANTLAFYQNSTSFTTGGYQVQGGGSLVEDGVGGLSLVAADAAGAVRIYTGSGTLRATFDAAGNFNLGSTNIMDSPAVPTIVSGFGASPTIAGRATAFRIMPTAGSTTGTVAFNTTYANPPVCVASIDNGGGITWNISTSTTQFGFSPSAAVGSGVTIYVLCRGY